MALIPYEQFGELRLRDFVPNPAEVSEEDHWEWMGSRWINESIGFTSFSRLMTTPDQTGGLEISFPELPPDAIRRLLATIGLPLESGMSEDDLFTALGEPAHTTQYVPDRISHSFYLPADSTQSYRVDCTVHEKNGLIYLSILRADLVSPEETDDDETEEEAQD